MAPKEEETMIAVNDYLVTTNRPYSVNDIFMNLHKEHGKAALQRCLDKLVSDERLRVKVNRKQSCYFANQNLLATCSDQLTKYQNGVRFKCDACLYIVKRLGMGM